VCNIRYINNGATEMTNLNWVETGGSIGKARRFPTFTVKINEKTGMFVAYDDTNGGSFYMSAKTMNRLEEGLRPVCNRRTI
jgi:hypothetical protein